MLITGHIPTNIKWKDTSIIDALKEEIDGSLEITAALGRLRLLLGPLTRSLKKWRKLIEAEAKVTNMLGLTRAYREFEKTSEIVVHILQGQESYFIHSLTLLADKYKFTPLGNEHDGLITMGKIPDEAIQTARKLRAFTVWS